MSILPKVIRTTSELIRWRNETSKRIGLVPTMGALHEGHATLLRRCRSENEISVMSLFVNPAQFGPQEDFSKYPRSFERDLEIAAQEGVDLVFAPSPTEIYPPGYSTTVEETVLSGPLCGTARPGHFRGVTTVVLKLFNLIRPEVAYFGLKDAQQFFVLKKMALDLNLNIQVEGVPTVRESDGLALSSRNVYLSPSERQIAPQIRQELQSLERIIKQWKVDSSGARSVEEILAGSKSRLEAAGFKVQYLEFLALPNLQPLPAPEVSLDSQFLIAIAAYLGNTRLIDNVIVST